MIDVCLKLLLNYAVDDIFTFSCKSSSVTVSPSFATLNRFTTVQYDPLILSPFTLGWQDAALRNTFFAFAAPGCSKMLPCAIRSPLWHHKMLPCAMLSPLLLLPEASWYCRSFRSFQDEQHDLGGEEFVIQPGLGHKINQLRTRIFETKSFIKLSVRDP